MWQYVWHIIDVIEYNAYPVVRGVIESFRSIAC